MPVLSPPGLRTATVGAALAATLWQVAPAPAAPHSGPGVRLGLATHQTESTLFDNTDDYQSLGASLGLDYQWALNPRFSLSPFVSFTMEGTGDLPEEPTVYHTLLGLEGRFWFQDVYLGAHAGGMHQAVDADTYDQDGTGLAFGLSLGLETDGGTFYEARFVRGQDLDFWADNEADVMGVRLNVGFRFH
jgi:hypothetical protein